MRSVLGTSSGPGARYDNLAGSTDAVPFVYESAELNAVYEGGGADLTLYVNSGKFAGRQIFARLRVDFNGDGVWDRTETYPNFNLSPLERLETYRTGTTAARTVTGSAWRDLTNGRVRLELWTARSERVDVRLSATPADAKQSVINLPYVFSIVETTPREPQRRAAVYDDSVLTSGFPSGRTGGGAAAYPMTPAEMESKIAVGLEAFRFRNSTNGSCANCHQPDGFDLAKIAYSDSDIRRRALEHVDATRAEQIVQLIHAMRVKHNIQRPFNPATFRPLQPVSRALPGANTVERDIAFMNHMRNDLRLLVCTDYVDTEAKAVAAEQELLAIDLTRLRIGVPLDAWSEDSFHGPSHTESSRVGGHIGSVAEWLPDMPTRPKATDEARFYELFDTYAANPTDTNLWKFYDAIGGLTESASAPWTFGSGHEYEWMLEKYRSVMVAMHMLRHDTIDYPKRTVDQTSDNLAAHRAIAIARNPLWRVGDLIRQYPLYPDGGDPMMLFPARIEAKIDPRAEARMEQSEIIELAWFWVGWQADPPLLTSDPTFATTSGDYFYPVNKKLYRMHYAFILAKMSVEKANAEGWQTHLGDGVDGHGMWASIRPFLVLKHSTTDRSRPGTGDVRREQHSRVIGNTAAMWIFLVARDLRENNRVYDAYGTLACVDFARRLVAEMLPERNHAALDQAHAFIRTRLTGTGVTDVRDPASTQFGMYLELFEQLNIPPAPYQR